MFYVCCESVCDIETAVNVTVRSVHKGMRAAQRAGSKLAKATGAEYVHALPVSMTREGSVAPRKGDVLLVTREGDDDFAAMAKVRRGVA